MSVIDTIRRWWAPDPDAVRDSMQFVGRARLVVHLFDTLGESDREHACLLAGYEPLLVFEFPPFADRTWWTYATAGLSLCPALDAHPPIELLLTTEEPAIGFVDVLFALALRDPGAIPYREGDTATLEGHPDLGFPLTGVFGFVRPSEPAGLLAFPDPSVRPEDERYILARVREDRTPVRFLRVVPLLDDDAASFAARTESFRSDRAWRPI